MNSELHHKTWAVLNHQGEVARGLTYAEAFDLAKSIREREGRSCVVVTSGAAQRAGETAEGAR